MLAGAWAWGTSRCFGGRRSVTSDWVDQPPEVPPPYKGLLTISFPQLIRPAIKPLISGGGGYVREGG